MVVVMVVVVVVVAAAAAAAAAVVVVAAAATAIVPFTVHKPLGWRTWKEFYSKESHLVLQNNIRVAVCVSCTGLHTEKYCCCYMPAPAHAQRLQIECADWQNIDAAESHRDL